MASILRERMIDGLKSGVLLLAGGLGGLLGLVLAALLLKVLSQ